MVHAVGIFISMFSLNEEQKLKFLEWVKTLPAEPPTAIGGAFTYMFTPTGLGVIVKVRYYNGSEVDLTSYEDW